MHTELTIYKIAVDFMTKKPKIHTADVVDKGGECYWSKNRVGAGCAFNCLTRIPKYGVFTSPELARRHFVATERAKADELRKQASEIDAIAIAAETMTL